MWMFLRSRLQPAVQTVSANRDDFIGKELARSLMLKVMDLHLKASHTRYKCHSFLAAPSFLPKSLENKTKHQKKFEEERKLKVEPNQTKSK